MTLTDPHVGTEPQYRPLGLPGCYQGIHYQPAIIDGGELVVFLGPTRFEWKWPGGSKGPHLFNAYTGEPHHNRAFVEHVDIVCDRRLDKMGQ